MKTRMIVVKAAVALILGLWCSEAGGSGYMDQEIPIRDFGILGWNWDQQDWDREFSWNNSGAPGEI